MKPDTAKQVEAPRSDQKHKSPMNPIQILNLLIVITILWILFGTMIGAKIAPNDDMFPHIKAKDLLLYYRMEYSYHAEDVVILTKNDTANADSRQATSVALRLILQSKSASPAKISRKPTAPNCSKKAINVL